MVREREASTTPRQGPAAQRSSALPTLPSTRLRCACAALAMSPAGVGPRAHRRSESDQCATEDRHIYVYCDVSGQEHSRTEGTVERGAVAPEGLTGSRSSMSGLTGTQAMASSNGYEQGPQARGTCTTTSARLPSDARTRLWQRVAERPVHGHSETLQDHCEIRRLSFDWLIATCALRMSRFALATSTS